MEIVSKDAHKRGQCFSIMCETCRYDIQKVFLCIIKLEFKI